MLEPEAAGSQPEQSTLIQRRQAMLDDLPWLLQLRRDTMDEHLEFAGIFLSEEDHLQRLMHEFSSMKVLCAGTTKLGILKLKQSPDEWELVQLQISPEHQGKGIGSQVLKELLGEAKAARVPVTLKVLKRNPAVAMYQRHGFLHSGEDEHEFTLRCMP